MDDSFRLRLRFLSPKDPRLFLPHQRSRRAALNPKRQLWHDVRTNSDPTRCPKRPSRFLPVVPAMLKSML